MKPYILTLGGSSFGAMVRDAVDVVHAASERLMGAVGFRGSRGRATAEQVFCSFAEFDRDLATAASCRELLDRYLRAVEDAGTPPRYLLTWKRLDSAVTAARCRDFYEAELLKVHDRARRRTADFSDGGHRFKIIFAAETRVAAQDELREMGSRSKPHAFYVDDYLTWHTGSLLEKARGELIEPEGVARGRRELDALLTAEWGQSSTPLRSFFSRAFTYTKMKMAPDSPMSGPDVFGYCTDQLFVNRAITLPHEQRAAAQRELGRMGGFLGAQFKAAEATIHAYRHLRSFDPPTSSTRETGGGASAWAEWLASGLDVEVRVHHAPRLDACMVQTRRRVIWLGDHLTPERRAFATAHELAHLILGHRGNSEYGLNTSRLGDFDARHFDLQEREANVFATILAHTLSGVAGVSVMEGWESEGFRGAPMMLYFTGHGGGASRGTAVPRAVAEEGSGSGRNGENALAREDAPGAGSPAFVARSGATGDGEEPSCAFAPGVTTARSEPSDEEDGPASPRSRTAA